MAFTACDDKLEITPKGQTTLETVDDLALLLNQEYDLMIMPFSDLGLICDESLGSSESVSEMLSQTKTLNYAYLTYDEKLTAQPCHNKTQGTRLSTSTSTI